MYAQIVMVKLGPGMRSTGEKMADQFGQALKAQKGFKSVTWFGDVETGEYGSFTLWETKEDVEAAAAVMAPKLEQAISGIAKAPPTRQFFEVYEPNA